MLEEGFRSNEQQNRFEIDDAATNFVFQSPLDLNSYSTISCDPSAQQELLERIKSLDYWCIAGIRWEEELRIKLANILDPSSTPGEKMCL